MTGSANNPLPDQAERDAITADLDTSMLVEAAAGTGKTTSMVARMVGLLAEDKCTVATLAAVTFTRKATAELRDRFRMQLERAAEDAEGDRRDLLMAALNDVEQCFIGTIHSFCARLLRERPIEAKIDVAFEELDADQEFRLRSDAWDVHIAELHAAADPILTQLDASGLTPAGLRSAYIEFAQYPDVDQWPAPTAPFDQALADEARRALRAYAHYMEGIAPGLPASAGNDKLIPFFHELPRRLRHTPLGENRALVDVLQDIAALSGKVVQKEWPGGKTQGRAELDRLEAFLDTYATPLVARWRACRYALVLDLLHGAVRRYDAIRAHNGVLSYQDLLMKAADLLREQPAVRRYFRRRFTHLLVDEFQDTDPIQAEVMLLLTAADHDQQDWRRCRPVPGALFVVGDPKQSIYRFRRADIVTYNEVRGILRDCGRIVGLTTNFRSTPPLIAWFNEVSRTLFPPQASDHSPADSPMKSPGGDMHLDDDTGATVLAVPDDLKTRAEVNGFEADAIARLIRDWIDRGLHVSGDFLILSRVHGPLVEYARALQTLGIPVEVTGGSAVNELSEVALLHTALAAVVEPDNPVALVGALRSELFGVSDTELYRFKKAGGTFNIFASDDHGPADAFAAIDEARARLRTYAGWLSHLPPIAAVERIAGHLGLFARAASDADGRDRGGGLCKAIELLRAASREYWTAADLAGYLWNLVDPNPRIRERHDGASLSPHREPPVRVMNLHQAKGLEAPVVFLADGSGQVPNNVDLCVVRGAGVVRGYLQLRGERKGAWGKGRVLAIPEGWAAKAANEQLFGEAEADRLLYVAATRARKRLVISRPAKRRRWEKLLAHVPERNVIRKLPTVAAPVVVTRTLPADAPRLFAEGLGERWAARCAPTYDVKRVKALTVTGSRSAGHPGEHGTEWGTVLHLLLEAAMNGPAGDLLPLATSALPEHGLDPADARVAVAIVRSVMRSDLWRRAQAGKPCLAEVPIQFMQPEAGPVPVIVRGVIDLVFREPAGWVIVDYKTDDRRGQAVEHLVEQYAGQVRLYAEAWTESTGEPVVETALYFVRTGRYRVVADSRGTQTGT